MLGFSHETDIHTFCGGDEKAKPAKKSERCPDIE